MVSSTKRANPECISAWPMQPADRRPGHYTATRLSLRAIDLNGPWIEIGPSGCWIISHPVAPERLTL